MSLYTFDEFRGIATHNGIRSDILSHHSRGGNNGILANCYTGQNCCTGTNPCIAADVYRFADELFVVVQVVIVGNQLYVGSDHCIIIDGDATS